MIGRTHRFHGYGSLRRVYANGESVRGSLINLKFSPRSPGKAYRAAVVVSRKVNKSAVVRNRIRRRIYELVRRSDNRPESTDLIFTVFSDQVANLDAAKLAATVDELLTKAK
jgi:ribonuclease P protein component